jgi:glycosyltransferase involved in cell wall biosynthesis
VSLDIVMPAYNEAERIGPTLRWYRRELTDPQVRFHVALDRCEDATAEVVAAHAADDPRVKMHLYPRLGKGGVIMETFRRCDGQYVAFVDADASTPPRELLRLVEAAREADGAIASRRHPAAILPRQRPLGRRIASVGFAWLVRRSFGLPYDDTQCGAKVLRREAAERLVPLLTARDLTFDVDLLVTAKRLGYRLVEVPTIWIDRDGSRLDVGNEVPRMSRSLLRLWWHHRLTPLEPSHADAPLITLPDAADRELVHVDR